MKSIILILLTLSVTGMAYANDTVDREGHSSGFKKYLPDMSGLLPDAKLKDHTQSLKWGYVGAGVTTKLLHLNAEWVNPYGIAYGKVGAFMNDDNEVGAQVGFRFPYHFTGVDQNGYYVGFYAGHLESAKLDGELHQRLGAGIDLSYVKLDKQRISTLSVGIGAGEKIEGRNGSQRDIKPQLQFAYSLSFGVF